LGHRPGCRALDQTVVSLNLVSTHAVSKCP
jgi:hypothetical protein